VARCLTITHAELGSAGFVGDELERQGYRLEPVHREGRSDWPSTDGADLVLVLGSDWSVYADETRAQVGGEVAAVRAAHRRGVPVFGVCFGAQVLAAALGGVVRLAEQLELGWHRIETCDPAIEPGPWMQWHRDTFAVPDGVEILARSAAGPQAMRQGRSFAVQFHPEVDADIVAAWVAVDGGRDLSTAGIDAQELIDTTRREAPRAEDAARRLVRWFCAEVAD
jgi:GMP synthase-like glutamine amidotransferase